MMSLQEIAFCYIIMMIATPITLCLLMAFKKVKEVKPLTELLAKEQDVACVACHAVRCPKPMLWTQEFFICFECLKQRKGPFMLGLGSFIAHPETGERVNSHQYDYEYDLDEEVTRVVDTVSYTKIVDKPKPNELEITFQDPPLLHQKEEQDQEEEQEEEQALWFQDLEDALISSKALIPKFRKRKPNFQKKDLKPIKGINRRNRRRIKASWVR